MLDSYFEGFDDFKGSDGQLTFNPHRRSFNSEEERQKKLRKQIANKYYNLYCECVMYRRHLEILHEMSDAIKMKKMNLDRW